MVKQYKDNIFEKRYYELEKKASIADFRIAHYIPYLETLIEEIGQDLELTGDSIKEVQTKKLTLLRNEFIRESKRIDLLEEEYIENPKNRLSFKFKYIDYLYFNKVSDSIMENAMSYIKEDLDSYYNNFYREASDTKEKIINYLNDKDPEYYNARRKKYHNESLQYIVKKVQEKNPILEYNGKLVQQIDPIYLNPEPNNILDFRTHFYAPKKYFLGNYYDTFKFNTILIWVITLILYITLYYDVLKKSLTFVEEIKIKEFAKKFGISRKFNFLKKLKIPKLKFPKKKK